MNCSENVAAGQKRGIEEDILDMEDDFNSNNSSLNSSEPFVKKHRVSCFENIHQSLLNSKSTMEQSSKDEKKGIFLLIITNSVKGWTCDQVMDYVREEIGESALLVNDFRDSDTDFKIKLKFRTCEQRNKVLEKLRIRQSQGQLCVDTEDMNSDDDEESNACIENREEKTEDSQSNISIDIWDVNPHSSYGLKESFLESLNITPPLSNWVLVTNFRCDKSELKEVMELAGHVVVCSVVTVATRYANVMYSHPLEAVQAISMLNGQTLYGQNLKIKMDNTSEYWKVLPKGLAHLGPGLGKYGKPVRDIAKQYERFISGKQTLIETKIFISEKSSDLLKEITQPSVSRPESRTYQTPDPVVETQDKTNDDNSKIKDMSPKNESIESDNQTKTISPDTERNSPLDTSYFHNKPITNCSPTMNKNSSNPLADPMTDQNAKESESLDTINNTGPNTLMDINQMGTSQDLNIKATNINPSAQSSFIGFNVGTNKQGTSFGPNPGANGQMASNMGPFPNMQSGIHAGPSRPGNFGPMGLGNGNMGVQGMQGPFGVRQMNKPMGPISRPMGMQNMVNPIHNQQGPINTGLTRVPVPANPGLGGIGSQAFRMNQIRPPASMGPFRNQMPGPGFVNPGVPRGPMQGPVMYSNAAPNTRTSGPFLQQQSVRPLEIYRGINAFSLKIMNIPPTIKLGGLCDKLSEFGQVTGLEFVGPGCAMVKFALADDAERCFRNYRQVFQY